jgi:hypothetical protein
MTDFCCPHCSKHTRVYTVIEAAEYLGLERSAWDWYHHYNGEVPPDIPVPRKPLWYEQTLDAWRESKQLNNEPPYQEDAAA